MAPGSGSLSTDAPAQTGPGSGMPTPLRAPRRHSRGRPTPVLTLLICLICLPELVLLLADYGLIGSPRWRLLAYQYGAFWAGLLYGWQPNYTAQPALMFVSYGFLHTGPAHLTGNMLGLGWLGARIIDRWGTGRFIWLYLAAMLGGAVGFGALTSSPAPMIGASGAVFGLAAAWMVGEAQDRRIRAHKAGHGGWPALWSTLKPALGLTLVLAGFNLISWMVQNGQLAWETHLGGFLAGLGVALLLPQREHASRTPAED